MTDSRTVLAADDAIKEMGFPIPVKPLGMPQDLIWPKNVADLSSNDLARHMTWWSGWSASARYALARAETNEEAYSEARRLKVQQGIFKSEGDYASVTELKAAVEQGKDVQELDAKLLKARAMKKMLKALLTGYEEKYAVVSREISRRTREEYEANRP